MIIAVGFWYKGINRDVCSVCDGIRLARRNQAEGCRGTACITSTLQGGGFVLVVVKFRALDGLGN